MLLVVALLLLAGCGGKENPVLTVYASQDQVYAEPIIAEFSRQTGIRVRALYDSEAVKTVGLVNRLLAERSRPQCDVFWNNEELRTRQLEMRGVLRPTNGWAAIGFRSRRLVVNTNRLEASQVPRSLHEITNKLWQGKVALAYPLFGTTATHFLALRQHWGESNWLAWCRGLAANQPLLVDGNSMVVQLVGRGEAAVGLTDSDDIAAGQRAGLPIAALPLTPETLLIPNTVAVIDGAPHPDMAQRFLDFMLTSEVAGQLVAAAALEAAVMTDEPGKTGLQVNWPELLGHLDGSTAALEKLFLR